ncbi:unknown [Choristoneura occidentalis granulovirus]|uniref:Uncharacterized protein n=1 Tax=Choristoneura occidentalis granulovirus TaxID=364745 RepID=Q1A4K2_9BBAC|nr:unknown [Choristoneura fumiferana granulovirus]ABC61228.1 unknown [Choristoneura fumiferana granulovirus]
MKSHILEQVILRRLKNNQIVNTIKQMINASKFTTKLKVKQKFLNEYYNVNNKVYSETVQMILDAFDIVTDEKKTSELLENSFYRNCKITNIVLAASINKISLTRSNQHVCLKIYLVGDNQLCKDCYELLNKKKIEQISEEDMEETNLKIDTFEPDINSRCFLVPENTYMFSCTYICDYCYTNKLYIKM